MKTKVRFEIQEREDLAHLSVEGSVNYNISKHPWQNTIENIEIDPDNHEKFTKLVLTAILNEENSFDCVFLEENPKLPKIARIWPGQLLEYFNIQEI